MGRDARDTMEPYPNLFFCMEQPNIFRSLYYFLFVFLVFNAQLNRQSQIRHM